MKITENLCHYYLLTNLLFMIVTGKDYNIGAFQSVQVNCNPKLASVHPSRSRIALRWFRSCPAIISVTRVTVSFPARSACRSDPRRLGEGSSRAARSAHASRGRLLWTARGHALRSRSSGPIRPGRSLEWRSRLLPGSTGARTPGQAPCPPGAQESPSPTTCQAPGAWPASLRDSLDESGKLPR